MMWEYVAKTKPNRLLWALVEWSQLMYLLHWGCDQHLTGDLVQTSGQGLQHHGWPRTCKNHHPLNPEV